MNPLWTQIYKLLAQVTVLRRRLILKKCKDYLGVDFTPLDVTPDLVACAEAVSTILKSCGCIDRIITGTWTLNDYLEKSPNWVPVNSPLPGDVAIAPTGTSKYGRKAPFPGHVFILGERGVWYSNDSYTGKWQANYNEQTAKLRYEKEGGYRIYYYRYLSIF